MSRISVLLSLWALLSSYGCLFSSAELLSAGGDSSNACECQEQPQRRQEEEEEEEEDAPIATLRVRAAVLLAVPFLYEEDDTTGIPANIGSMMGGSGAITAVHGLGEGQRLVGLLVDLMNALHSIARQEDNVKLTFELDILRDIGYTDSLTLLTKDCHEQWSSTNNLHTTDICNRYDAIVADYWARPDRFDMVDFTPSWLGTSVGMIKYIGHGNNDNTMQGEKREVNTMEELIRYGQKVCVHENSATPDVLSDAFPNRNISFQFCQQKVTEEGEDCFQQLREGKCALYAKDQTKARYNARQDPQNLDVTKESFRPQKLVWAIRRAPIQQPDMHLFNLAFYMKRWIYAAEQQSILERLNTKYFFIELCSIGTAGANCDQPCHPVHGTSDRFGQCVCESTRYEGADCSIERQTDHSLISNPLIAVGVSLFGINVLVCVGCGIWLWRERFTPEVRMAQPLFLAMVLLGCVISSSTILALSQQDDPTNPNDDGDVACMAIPTLYSIGFCVTFGSLFAKIFRVQLLFNSAAAMRRVVVTAKTTLTWIASLLLVDAIILIAWGAVDPLRWERVVVDADKFGYPLETRGYCTSDHWAPFAVTIATLHLALLLAGSWCCYMARNIPKEFSEGKYVAVAMVSNLEIFVVGLPVLILVGDANSNTSYFVPTIMIWLNDIAVVAIIFGNLIRSVHFGGPDNTRTGINARSTTRSVHAAMSQYSRSQTHHTHTQVTQPTQSKMDTSGHSSLPGESFHEEELDASSLSK